MIAARTRHRRPKRSGILVSCVAGGQHEPSGPIDARAIEPMDAKHRDTNGPMQVTGATLTPRNPCPHMGDYLEGPSSVAYKTAWETLAKMESVARTCRELQAAYCVY